MRAGLRLDGLNPVHASVAVFVGDVPGHRGRAGSLVLDADDWRELSDGARKAGTVVEVAITRVARRDG